MTAHPLSSTGTKNRSSRLPAANRALVVTAAVLMVHLAAAGSARATAQLDPEAASAPGAATPSAASSATGAPAGQLPAPAAVPDTPAPQAQPKTAPAVRLAETTETAPGTSAGQSKPGTPPGTPPPGAPPPGAPQGGPPPLPVLLGFADFMLGLDRPYEAEKIYRGILAFDPNNPAAKAGLREVASRKKPTAQLLSHYYEDNHDVEVFAIGGGPTFRTRYGSVTFTTGTGTYRNNNDPTNGHNPLSLTPTIPTAVDNHSLQRNTYNLILDPYFGKWDGELLVSHVTYDRAPDRTLWNLRATYTVDPRTRYTVTHGRHDSYYQSQVQQFFAPETIFMLLKKITYQDTSIDVQHPIVGKVDLEASYRYFNYSDGNTRDNYRVYAAYRLKGDQKRPMPVFRVGLDTILDNNKFFTLDYSTSRQFNVVSVAADYFMLTSKTRYGFYASYPLAKQHFNPPAAFVGFFNRHIGSNLEVYAQVYGFLPPADGLSLSFGDYLMGVHVSF